MRKMLLLLPAVISISALALIPKRSVFVAPWRVRILDRNAMPVANVRVSQSWDNYSLDLHGGADLYTGADGEVFFQSAQKKAPLVYWLLRPAITKFEYGAHASTDR